MARGRDAELRALPAVHELAAELDAPHVLAVAAARRAIDEQRSLMIADADDGGSVLERARGHLAALRAASLRRVINATGVIVHTNLGRAPLAATAREAVARAAEGYSQPRARAGVGHARIPARARRRPAARADRGRRRDGRQQRRGRRAPGRRRAGRPRPRDRRLARAAGRDRRRVPDSGRDRAVGFDDDRGRDHQSHQPARLRTRALVRRRRGRGDPARAPVELPDAGVRGRRSRSRSSASSARR